MVSGSCFAAIVKSAEEGLERVHVSLSSMSFPNSLKEPKTCVAGSALLLILVAVNVLERVAMQRPKLSDFVLSSSSWGA